MCTVNPSLTQVCLKSAPAERRDWIIISSTYTHSHDSHDAFAQTFLYIDLQLLLVMRYSTPPTLAVLRRLRLIIQTSLLGSYMRKSTFNVGRLDFGYRDFFIVNATMPKNRHFVYNRIESLCSRIKQQSHKYDLYVALLLLWRKKS